MCSHRLSPSQAVAELFARSFVPFHRHQYVDSAFEFLQEVVSAVPCYHYAFEPNQGAVERIRNSVIETVSRLIDPRANLLRGK